MILVNSELNNLQVLPSLGPGIGDKFIVLKTVASGVDRETNTREEWDKYMDDLLAALPDYLGWLESWEIPVSIRDSRYGVKSYHNQEILGMLDELGSEVQLLHLI